MANDRTRIQKEKRETHNRPCLPPPNRNAEGMSPERRWVIGWMEGYGHQAS